MRLPCCSATIMMEGKGCNRACMDLRYKEGVMNDMNGCHFLYSASAWVHYRAAMKRRC